MIENWTQHFQSKFWLHIVQTGVEPDVFVWEIWDPSRKLKLGIASGTYTRYRDCRRGGLRFLGKAQEAERVRSQILE